MEEINYIETRPQLAHCICSMSEYFRLNEQLSLAKGYDLTKDTQRCFPMIPTLAKVNIQYDLEGKETSYDVACVVLIDSFTQENYPELLTGLNSVNNYTPCNDILEEIFCTGLTTQEIDWLLNHFIKFDTTVKTLWLEDGSPSSMDICEQLANKGITVIVVDNEN